MDRDELQSLQAPLKDRYRDDPESAVVTLKAEGRLGEGITCSVNTGRALAEAGLHPATGGDGMSLCSGTMRSVATSIEVPLRGGVVRAEGDLDFRGTLAVAKDCQVGFRAIRLSFDLDTDATDEQLDTLVRLTERFCVVLQTIASPPQLSVTRS
jgi:hypothetical protein